MKDKLLVIKIGGNIVDDPSKLDSFLFDFSKIKSKKILIHGGGKIASRFSERIGVVSKIIDGRRVTDSENLDIVTMVYGGLISKQIIAKLQRFQCNAIGLSGPDGNSILSKKRNPLPIDFGLVGDVLKINSSFIKKLIDENIIPVFNSIGHDGEGKLLNTNADTIASEIAIAMRELYEVKLIYCFEKSGVLLNSEDEKTLIEKIDLKKYKDLQEEGNIKDGMIPKMENAYNALKKGVSEVIICNSDYFKNSNKSGTVIVL